MANEKRLIDANVLKAHVDSVSTHWLCEWDTLGVLNAIDNQPAVDAVEVVRCKDCKWFYRDEEFNRAWCGYNKCGANEVAVNGYCYRGERREGE